jgi:isocitrate/isopropylmalate dehydrogenase
MLERLGQRERGVRLETAIRKVVAEARDLTPDLGGAGTTAGFTDRVVEALRD